jgi:hypothetical protein
VPLVDQELFTFPEHLISPRFLVVLAGVILMKRRFRFVQIKFLYGEGAGLKGGNRVNFLVKYQQ